MIEKRCLTNVGLVGEMEKLKDMLMLIKEQTTVYNCPDFSTSSQCTRGGEVQRDTLNSRCARTYCVRVARLSTSASGSRGLNTNLVYTNLLGLTPTRNASSKSKRVNKLNKSAVRFEFLN